MNIDTLKVGDSKLDYKEAYAILNRCASLVRLDNCLTVMEQDYAITKLYHIQCHLILEEINIGEYVNV